MTDDTLTDMAKQVVFDINLREHRASLDKQVALVLTALRTVRDATAAQSKKEPT